MNILDMGKEELLRLRPESVTRLLTADEVVHTAKALGAFWGYDYKADQEGRFGLHALLKSGLHSDGFFVSKILLDPDNICEIMAAQIVMKLAERGITRESMDYVAGIPDGATKLGRAVAKLLDRPVAEMQKEGGSIDLVTDIPEQTRLLLVEDFCTRGIGFAEAARAVRKKKPAVFILPVNPVMINRGGRSRIEVDGFGVIFTIVAVVDWRVQDWQPEECPLCANGSLPIKPKVTEETWQSITTSQKAV